MENENLDSKVVERQVNIHKYACIFVVASIPIGILLGFLFDLLGNGGSATSIISAMGASSIAGYIFATKERRNASDKEKEKFAFFSLVYQMIFALIVIILLGYIPVISALLQNSGTALIFLGVLVFLFLLSYWVIKYFFGQSIKNTLAHGKIKENNMSYKGLSIVAFLVLLAVAFIGFDSTKFNKTLVKFGVVQPKFSDVQYENKNLQSLFTELYFLDPNTDFVKNEFEWLASKSKGCVSEECVDERVLKHQEELQYKLADKLYSATVDSTGKEIVLPTGIGSLNINANKQYLSQMAYAPDANILAYLGANGKIHIVDLNEGKYINELNKSDTSKRRYRDLKLSNNGKILLSQYGEFIELISTESGNVLAKKEYSGEVDFSRNSNHILLRSKKSVVMLDRLNLELTDISLDIAENGNRRIPMSVFHSEANILGIAGEQRGELHFYFFDEQAKSFKLISAVKIKKPSKYRGALLEDFLFDQAGKIAYAFSYKEIYKIDIQGGSYYEFVELPYTFLHRNKIIQDKYILNKSSNSKRTKRHSWNGFNHFDVIDLSTGKFADFDHKKLQYAKILPTKLKNSFLIANNLGVKLVNINEKGLVFKDAEEINPPQAKKKKSYSDSKKLARNTKAFEQSLRVVGKGKEGIDQALKLGLIRPASDYELNNLKYKNKSSSKILENLRFSEKYIVLKPVKFTGGLGGANMVVFIAPNSKLSAFGDIGHSVVLFSDTGACKGVLCRVK